MLDAMPDLPNADHAATLLALYQSKERDFADYDCSHVDLSASCFSYANFRRASLRHVDWHRSNLRGIDLSDANLSQSNLNNADLRGAALDNSLLFMASLDGSDLGGADLSDASLDLTTLTYANLQCANLRGTYLRGIDLSQTDLQGAYFDDRTQFDPDFDPLSAGMRSEIELDITDLLRYLNQVSHAAEAYLGRSTVQECWNQARFNNRYLSPFQFDGDGQFIYSTEIIQPVGFLHLKWLQLWMNKFVRNVALTSSEVPYILEQDHLLVLKCQSQAGGQDLPVEHSHALFGYSESAQLLVAPPSAVALSESISAPKGSSLYSELPLADHSVATATVVMSPPASEPELHDTSAAKVDSVVANESVTINVADSMPLASPVVVASPIAAPLPNLETDDDPRTDRNLSETQPQKHHYYQFADFFAFQPTAGAVFDRHGSRNVFAGEDFILALMQGFEREVGNASSKLSYDLGQAWGKRDFDSFQSWFEAEFAKAISDCQLSFVLEAWWWAFTAQGWGTWEVNLERQADGFLFINIFDSAVARTLGNVGKPVCHLYAGLFAGFFSQLVGQDLACIELQCYGMGDTYCKFLLGKQKCVDAATFWQTEGAALADIEARLRRGESL